MKAKAAIFVEERKPLVIDEITVDGPREGEVLVKLTATGICHTDLHEMSGNANNPLMPAVLGHEGAGMVVEVGPGVRSLKEGDHVIPLFIPECGECPQCRSPLTNLCSAIDDTLEIGMMPDGTSRLHWRGRELHHFMGTSTFAEYTVVPEIAAAKVRPDAPLDRLGLLGCGITTGVGAALWTAGVTEGATTAVFGCGPIGLSAVQGCRLAGASQVIALDLHEERLEMARLMGATHTINAAQEDGVSAVKQLTDGGADFTFEATGNTEVMRQAFEACRYGGGKCCLIGVAAKGKELCVVPRMLISGRSLTGTAFGGCSGRSQLPELVDWYMEGRLKVDELVTEFIALEEINEALEKMKRDEGYRYIVRYE
ncbi:MAG TPA: zinc-binding dehydrogenase [Armatimonadota bacterium]|jgi:S-(hydroxymethyl)glutathione dehydrogenase/alcohol dehydrogenase